uniref:Uncharacterized protein n=1 Tax=Rhizophora mucronata TaxID=61149 RepID=A0A2P2NIT7_RHIMU
MAVPEEMKENLQHSNGRVANKLMVSCGLQKIGRRQEPSQLH